MSKHFRIVQLILKQTCLLVGYEHRQILITKLDKDFAFQVLTTSYTEQTGRR